MKKMSEGFTLIEILIALAILSIALTAIIHTSSKTIRDTQYLESKIMANWVANEVLNEIRANVIVIAEGDEVEKETTLLNHTWPWIASVNRTDNNHIKKISVTVFSPDKQSEITNLESYLYVQPTNQ